MKQITLQVLKIPMVLLVFLCLGNLQLFAQVTPCGAGQKYNVVAMETSSNNNSVHTGTLIPSIGVTTTRVDNTVGTVFGQASTEFSASTGALGFAGSTYSLASGGGYACYLVYKGGTTTITYTFSSPVTDPYISVFGGCCGLYPGNTIDFPGKTVTKVDGSAGFVVTGTTASVPGVFGLQTGLMKLSGTMTSFQMVLSAGATYDAWPCIAVGTCYTPPSPPCVASKFKTTVGESISYTIADKQAESMLLDIGNSVKITRADVAGATPSGQVNLYTNAYAANIGGLCFPNTTNFLDINSGGYSDYYIYAGGTTDVTYTFCRPVTDPYIFLGAFGLDEGASAEFLGKTITYQDGDPGFSISSGNKIEAVGVDQNGYVKLNGTMTTFTIRFKASPIWGGQIFSTIVGTCINPTPPVGTPATCTGTAAWKNVSFLNSGFTGAEFQAKGTSVEHVLNDVLNVAVTDAFGSGVKASVKIEDPSATAGVCGDFASTTLSGVWNWPTVGTGILHQVPKGGQGVKATYKFSRPVKLKMKGSWNYGIVHGEFATFEAKKAGAPVATILSLQPGSQLTTPGTISTLPGSPNVSVLNGTINGNFWEAATTDEIDEISITYKSDNDNLLGNWKEEQYAMEICSAPCAIVYPACPAASQRTDAFGFTQSSPTAAAGTKGTNTLSMTTTPTIPILATATTGASTLGDCANTDQQFAVNSGGWALLGAKANSTGKITMNFTQPVTNPIILVWNIYSTTKIDVAGVSTCLKPLKSWFGATTGPGLTNTADITSITGTGLFWGIGYYQIPGTYTSLTFDVQTGVFENWFYMSVGEGNCNTTAQPVSTAAPRTLSCPTPGTDVRTYDANFTTTIVPYVSASGKAYTAPTASYANDITLNTSNTAGGLLGLYSYTSYPAGQASVAASGCAPGGALSSAGGGAAYAYAGAGSWNNGVFTFTFKDAVMNPIIKIKYMTYTKLTFKDCNGNLVPIAAVNLANGLAISGSSVSDANGWGDLAEGEGMVQLLGRFTTITINVEKTDVWVDYFSLTVAEQVCINPASVTKICALDLPLACAAGTELRVPMAKFAKVNALGATGTVLQEGNPNTFNVLTNAEVLTASDDKASSLFKDAACYSIRPSEGGHVQIRDIGGATKTTVITFTRPMSNPTLYFKDVIRSQLSFATTTDVSGNAVCCMKRISGSNGFTVDETTKTITDSNPTQMGSATQKVDQACGSIQLIGTFKSITIVSTRPTSTITDNWDMTIGGTIPFCVPIPQQVPLRTLKSIINIALKDPNNPTGNQLVTFEVEAKNMSTTTKINNLILADRLDEKMPAGAVVAVNAAPSISWTNSGNQAPNPAFNGTTVADLLLPAPQNNMLNPQEAVRVRYTLEINPSLIPTTGRFNNSIVAGSSSMSGLFASDPFGNPGGVDPEVGLFLPGSIMAPKNIEMSMCSGGAPAAFANFVQCGAKVMANAQCGTVKWSWTSVIDNTAPKCGEANTQIVTFKGIDDCGNNYEYKATFKTIDNCAPAFDMLPMNKTIDCASATADATLSMWLASAGGAWFGDVGSPIFKPIVSHDFAGTATSNCAAGTAQKIVKFTITDACGNTATATATVTFTPKPTASTITMTKPATDNVVSCDATMTFDKPTMKTTCAGGIVNSTFKDDLVKGNCPNEYNVIRTWTFTDVCGNNYVVKNKVTVTDKDAPVFAANLPKTVTMTKAYFTLWRKVFFANYVKATDICSQKVNVSAPTTTVIDTKTVECKATAKDECGNISNYVCRVTFSEAPKVYVDGGNKTTTSKVANDDNDATTKVILDEIRQLIEQDVEVAVEAVIYPNPTSSVVNIIPAQGFGALQKIHVYTMDGRILLNMDVEGQDKKMISVDISSFNEGTYIIEMEHTEKKLYRQVQKVN